MIDGVRAVASWIQFGLHKACIQVGSEAFPQFVPPYGFVEREPVMAADWTNYVGMYSNLPNKYKAMCRRMGETFV